jgi:serine/threonine protein kinase
MSAETPTMVVGKRYTLTGRLGAGGMGTVYRATDRLTGQTVALKRVTAPTEQLLFGSKPSDSSADLFLALAHEFQTLSSLRHPYIISVLDYGFDMQQNANRAGAPTLFHDGLCSRGASDNRGRKSPFAHG